MNFALMLHIGCTNIRPRPVSFVQWRDGLQYASLRKAGELKGLQK
jgi:hypothetical protein